MSRSRSFTDEDEPLLFGKSTLGSVLQPEFGDDYESVDITAGMSFAPDPWRWLVLFSFCFAAWVNSILWITFAPIAVATEEFYGISAFAVNGMWISRATGIFRLTNFLCFLSA